MEGKPTNGDHIHAKSVPDKTLLTCYRVPGPPIVSSSQRPPIPQRWMYYITSTRKEGLENIARFSCALHGGICPEPMGCKMSHDRPQDVFITAV